MPTVQARDYRIRDGIRAVGDMTDTYKIESIVAQTDQGAVPWLAPDIYQSTPPRQSKVVQTLDMSQTASGFYTFEWVFSYWTNDMLGYWHTTFLPSSVESANVTVKAYDDTDTAIHLTAVLLKPRAGDHMTQAWAGWRNVRMRFAKGVVIT